MPVSNPPRATVRHALLQNKRVAECLATLDNVCTAGAQCPAVQSSPMAKQALTTLQTSVTTAHASLNAKLALAQQLMAAIKTLNISFGAVRTALSAYETSVNFVANGDASVINAAGCLSRIPKTPSAALGNVTAVQSKPGKNPTEAILTWPAVAGATSYAIEVNTTPQNPAGTWTAIASGTSRRRVVKGPAPASQILARVAAQGSDGTPSAWSDPVLVTTL
jgi:hypothetical protein